MSTSAIDPEIISSAPRCQRTVARFRTGRLLIADDALHWLTTEDIQRALARHRLGDWGVAGPELTKANASALVDGHPVRSVYQTQMIVTFCVTTEWDRSYTSVWIPKRS